MGHRGARGKGIAVTQEYQPRQGDIVWIDMEPQAGKEITKRRPALVVWGNDAHALIRGGITMVCPITSTDSGFPLHVPLDSGSRNTTGFVVCEQAKALDLRARNAHWKDRASEAVISEVRDILKSLLD